MRKDRNSFFESSNYNMSSIGPNIGMGMPNMNAASSNFYAAQNIPMPLNYPSMNQGQSSTINELESRIARLERNINRLDARLNKLEGSTFINNNYDTDGSMYMV